MVSDSDSSDELTPRGSSGINQITQASNIVAHQMETLYEQDFYSLRSECLQSGKLFEDPEFLPEEEFLRDRSKKGFHDIVWLRPPEMCRPDQPILVSNKNEGFDIRQGLDAWFVPAFSAISDSEALLRHVVPINQGFQKDDYAGIFHFRFWFGRWIEIVIDDRLPTRNGNLIYMKSSSRLEFWPALLEKAYAKAKGNYELLNNWLPIDACIELTGGCPERVKQISQLLSGDRREADRLFMDILRANTYGNIPLLTCNPRTDLNARIQEEARQLGLEPKYIYRITQVADLGQGRKLIRIKNCSGSTDPMWKGAWSPNSQTWDNVSDATRRELDGEAFHDGGFWIGYQDLLKYFDIIDFCHINKDVNREIVFNGRWEIDLNAGGVQKGDFKNYAKNPQCFIELQSRNHDDPEDLCSAIISLMQRRRPASKVKGVNKIGFRVYRVDKDADELSSQFFSYRRNDGSHKAVAKTPTWQDGRETNIRVRLPKGKYCIVPSTFLPGQEGDFILRVHIEQYGEDDDSSSNSDNNTVIEARHLTDMDEHEGSTRLRLKNGADDHSDYSGTYASRQLYRNAAGSARNTPLYGSKLDMLNN